ncbi:MAG: hypothetical protein ACE37D_20090, partial [Pseudomonadales bacterium]
MWRPKNAPAFSALPPSLAVVGRRTVAAGEPEHRSDSDERPARDGRAGAKEELQCRARDGWQKPPYACPKLTPGTIQSKASPERRLFQTRTTRRRVIVIRILAEPKPSPLNAVGDG